LLSTIVSIRALARRATPVVLEVVEFEIVSIRALARRATRLAPPLQVQTSFNPRPRTEGDLS